MPASLHALLVDLATAVDAVLDPSDPSASLTDADLLRRANLVAAIPAEEQASFATACGKDEEMHRLALDLAGTRLPAALDKNLSVFIAPDLVSCTEADLPLPQPLFFALLSSHATLCSCLMNRGASDAERSQIQRAVLPILAGILGASGAGYGYRMAPQDPWPNFFASYACMFLDQEVTDEEVLADIVRLDMCGFFDGFVSSAEETGAVLCSEWLKTIEARLERHATSDGGK